MRYVEIQIPSNVLIPRCGDGITVNAFSPQASTHQILSSIAGAPRTLRIEIGSEGINIPAAAMMRTALGTWVNREAVFAPRMEVLDPQFQNPKLERWNAPWRLDE